MTIRAKQKRRQRATIERMAKSVLSPWHHILGRGYISWRVFSEVLKEVAAEEDRIGFYGTGSR